MKKLFSLLLVGFFVLGFSQETANRFFYELTFKPKKDSTRLDKVMTVLDITSKKSIYQDYTMPAQDSIIKVAVDEMQKTKAWKDLSKTIVWPKFSYKIEKPIPNTGKETYIDKISQKDFSYEEDIKFDWKMTGQKEKIGEYNTQKATASFGGRNWTAWFSTDIPLQDGPYKFYGLPGLIVKIEDDQKNYSWLLKGNKKIENYSEKTEVEKLQSKMGMSGDATKTTKEKFEKAYNVFKADPLAEFRPYMTPEMMSQKMPGSNTTIGDYVKDQEKRAKDFFNANNNPIEIQTSTSKK